MHKPFDVHSSNTWVFKFHEGLEFALVSQFMIVLNEVISLPK